MADIHDKPELWKRIKEKYLKSDKGGRSGIWSARKAQLSVLEYKREGGGYTGTSKASENLKKWTKEDWTTKSGKPSLETGERYLPKKAIQALPPALYALTSKLKKEGLKKGEEQTAQPKEVINIARMYR